MINGVRFFKLADHHVVDSSTAWRELEAKSTTKARPADRVSWHWYIAFGGNMATQMLPGSARDAIDRIDACGPSTAAAKGSAGLRPVLRVGVVGGDQVLLQGGAEQFYGSSSRQAYADRQDPPITDQSAGSRCQLSSSSLTAAADQGGG